MTGFIWSGSKGAQAVEHLRSCEMGTVIESPTFAAILKVDPRALHQLLENAVKLRMLKKVRVPGRTCVGWTLGAGKIGATIERRRDPVAPPLPGGPQRRRTDPANKAANDSPAYAPEWPPQFKSQWTEPDKKRGRY